ncbi:hypothetical protein Psi02_27150 [Planotetraspora silvatica]|uniref:Uncharacterized protein n=1 Tax=Planotetraspora silvatica TaxID=234614 RepID=A0A8J3UN52_9ACTN|nr:hypothetical protein [Planotetraspora silvatica]GII46291.1 hypothetical protein Psi02_27150 [Planotetraspora silvatica]
MKPQGWYRDPYGIHEDRYFSDGRPTKLVRDGAAEVFDEPPPGLPPGPLVEVTSSEPGYGGDLRRADDFAAGPAVFDKRKAVMDALESVCVYGPVN